jgi:hypothetical protein
MIPIVNVDWVTVIVAAIAAFVVGMLWYSPALFGKKYMKIMGVNEKDMSKNKDKMTGIMAQAFVVEVIMAYVLIHVFAYSQASSIADAVQGAIWLWLGFIATTTYMGVLYEKKSMDWFIMTAGHYLFVLIAMGIVIVSM